MARIRCIKPEFFANEQVASLPYEWRLLFIGLWTHADREGRLQDRPARLKAMLFPYDDLDVNEGLGRLANAGLITRYEGNGLRLMAIPTWAKHQLPHKRESQSVLPPPEGTALVVPEHNLGPPEGKGREGNRKGTIEDSLRERFDVFWQAYPKKVGKDAAWKEWTKRAPPAELLEVMLATLSVQRKSAQWTKDGGEYIPHPRTWLSQGRWQDEEVRGSSSPLAVLRLEWSCPHVDQCSHSTMCKHKITIGAEKYPIKAKESA